MRLDDMPDWLPGWCLDHLGAEPAELLFGLEQISTVFGLRLASGVDVVIKARGDDARGRALAADLPCVLGHADFEAQNLRWHGRELWAVHDWDSLAWQPEAALVGAASGVFPRGSGLPTLAPIASSEAFLAAYQHDRGRPFTAVELQVAWAASLWPAAHNARWEALHGQPPVCGTALRAQAAERLRRANAENGPTLSAW